MYAMSKLGKELKTCANEIKVLYGAHAMIGIIKYPRIHMYWQRVIRFDLIAQAITRDSFFFTTFLFTFCGYQQSSTTSRSLLEN